MFSWQYCQYLLNLAEGLQRFVRHNNFLKEGFKSGFLAALVQISSTIKKELRNLRFRQHPCVFFFLPIKECAKPHREPVPRRTCCGLGLVVADRENHLSTVCVESCNGLRRCGARGGRCELHKVCVCVWDFVCAMIMLKSNTNITRRGKHKCMLEQQHINPCGSVCADTIADKRTFVQWNQMISTGMDLSGKWNHTSTHWVTR